MSLAESVAGARLAPGPASPELSREAAFDVLSSQRRRYVLHHLLGDEAGGESELRDLTTRVAAWENDTDPERVTSKQRMRVYTALRQSHLPKMDREGVVEFDPVSGEVELTEEAEELAVYLDAVPRDGMAWSDYYLGLGALSLGLAAVALLEVFPFALLPDAAWMLAIAVLLIASGAVQKYRTRTVRHDGDGVPPA